MNNSPSLALELIIWGLPLPWKAPYVGTRGAFSPRTKVMNDFKEILRGQYKGPILETPLICDMFFYMPIPKSASKKKQDLMIMGALRPTSTPDIDNLRKLGSDVLQGVVIKNDSQIVEGWTSKEYSLNPRTIIRLKEYICH